MKFDYSFKVLSHFEIRVISSRYPRTLQSKILSGGFSPKTIVVKNVDHQTGMGEKELETFWPDDNSSLQVKLPSVQPFSAIHFPLNLITDSTFPFFADFSAPVTTSGWTIQNKF
jgi:hypothetical protein